MFIALDTFALIIFTGTTIGMESWRSMNGPSMNDRTTPLRIAIRNLTLFLRTRSGRYADYHAQFSHRDKKSSSAVILYKVRNILQAQQKLNSKEQISIFARGLIVAML